VYVNYVDIFSSFINNKRYYNYCICYIALKVLSSTVQVMHYRLLCVCVIKGNRRNVFSEIQQGVGTRADEDVDGEGIFAQSALVG